MKQFFRNAQLEASFQWIYVIIAGGTFLLLSFFIFRSCATSSQNINSANSFDSGVTSLDSLAWQVSPKSSVSSVSFPDSVAICPAGTITLKDNKLQKSLDRMPIFISPSVGDNTTIFTREVSLPASGALRLGTMVYAVDSRIEYLIIDEKNNGATSAYPGMISDELDVPNVKVIDMDSLGTEIGNHKSADLVIVSFENSPMNTVGTSEGINVFGRKAFFIQAKSVGIPLNHNLEFYEANSTGWILKGYSNYTDESFLTGAIVSANMQNYECSKNAVIDRMNKITLIYENRSSYLSNSASLSVECKALHANASLQLNALNKMYAAKKYNAYLSTLFAENNNKLRQYQDIIFGIDCPVIG